MTDPFQAAALDEYQKATAQLESRRDPATALQKSYTRYDTLIARAMEASPIKPACKAGCAFCCHYKVEVRAHEILLIKDYMSKTWSEEKITAVLADVEANAAIIRTLSPEQHLVTNIQCALLQDNQCSIYPVRPFRCRNFHSTDANACEQSHGDPGNMDIATGMIEDIAMLADAHTQGFEAAAEHTGRDNRVYDFSTALLEAFSDKSATKRHQRGKKTFQQAIEVIL